MDIDPPAVWATRISGIIGEIRPVLERVWPKHAAALSDIDCWSLAQAVAAARDVAEKIKHPPPHRQSPLERAAKALLTKVESSLDAAREMFPGDVPARSSIRPTRVLESSKSVRQAVADLLSDGEEINLRHNVVRLMANALVQTWERADCKVPLGTHRKGALTRAATMLLDMAGTSIGRDVVSDALRIGWTVSAVGLGAKRCKKCQAKRAD